MSRLNNQIRASGETLDWLSSPVLGETRRSDRAHFWWGALTGLVMFWAGVIFAVMWFLP